jgi:hypothetical protein
MSQRATLVFACVVSVAAAAAAGEPDPRLAPLLPLVGKTWRGAFATTGAAKPVVDVQRFELALGGQAVRSSHSINDGDYGGESLFTWDAEKKAIVYTYVTTGGFYTTGVLEADTTGGFKSHEIVHGTAGGVREVEATSRLLPDGSLHVRSRYLKDGKWADGHEVHYSVDPNAVVRFKD